jgi:hypothetical protein
MDPAGAFFRGQEAVRAEQDRNMLRQQQAEQMQFQRENMLAQRDERAAQAAERRAREARAAERQKFLTGAAEALAQGGQKLDRPTMMKVLQFGVQADEPTLIQFAREGLKALDEEDLYRSEATRFGLPGGAAPSVVRQAPAALPAAPAAPTSLLAGTPFDIGLPAPTNAMVAPPTGFTREQVQNMLTSPSARVREQGKTLVSTLPKEAPLSEISKLQREIDALPPGSPLRATLEARQKMLTTRPEGTKVEVKLAPQEKEEQGARGKLLVEQYKVVSDAARLAQKTLPALETQVGILDKGFRTGFGTDVQKVGASVLAALGVPEAAKFATDAQTFLAATQQAVLQRQLEQKGPQTEADAQRITQTGAQLGNTPEANRFMIDVAKAQLKRDIEQRNFYDKWWQANKTYDGAEDAWFSGEGNKSLFDRPELKKYAAPKPQAPAAGGSWRVVR